MQNRHFIQWIEVYDGDLFVTRVDLTAEKTRPDVTLRLVLNRSTELRFYERCNLHGTWENRARVEVV
jgi:desulfoferrodoxin-like iron-binding protein